MRDRTGWRLRGAGRGFTLIEVLLATALLLLLAGAAVFSFATLERGAKLDEGATQFESLLRFARAHAADKGRQVRLVVDESVDADFAATPDKVRLTWEPEPLGAPGVFQDVPEVADYLERINGLVQIEAVRLIGPENAGAAASSPGADDGLSLIPPLQFHPDGASDSAEIVLFSRDPEDPRRIRLRLAGLTGVVKRALVEEGEAGTSNQVETATGALESGRPPTAVGMPAPAAREAAKPVTAPP